MDELGSLRRDAVSVVWTSQLLLLRTHFWELISHVAAYLRGVNLLADKTGGKKFSKEFEEASSKLEEFVNGLDKQVKNGPSLTEALENAGIFYEAQYKEVKVVANVSTLFLDSPRVDRRLSVLAKRLGV